MNQRESGEPPDLTLNECPHCGNLVPVGVYCGYCGAHFSDAAGRARFDSYAASPGEHLIRPTIISTLFPHLPHRHAHTFREAFAGGVLIVLVLAAFRLYTSALIAAALILPILYLLYLYEIEIYEHEPVTVIAATFLTGAALGAAYTLVTGKLVSASLSGTQQGVFVSGVLLPVIAQLLMVAGPLLLLSRAHFDEALDGLTFGVSAALGFTLAGVLTGYWHVFTSPLQGSAGVSAESVLRLFRTGIVVALVNATTTGMITAALWTFVHKRSRTRHFSHWRGLPATTAVAFGAQVALGLIGYFVRSLLLLVVVWAIAAVVLLVWLRVIVHHALLDEGADLFIGEPSACPECHRLVPTMLFCPVCGVARSASSKGARPAPPETADAG
jgi:RNA polymerase subunit RPABC4/transcription elongation factor Spt4